MMMMKSTTPVCSLTSLVAVVVVCLLMATCGVESSRSHYGTAHNVRHMLWDRFGLGPVVELLGHSAKSAHLGEQFQLVVHHLLLAGAPELLHTAHVYIAQMLDYLSFNPDEAVPVLNRALVDLHAMLMSTEHLKDALQLHSKLLYESKELEGINKRKTLLFHLFYQHTKWQHIEYKCNKKAKLNSALLLAANESLPLLSDIANVEKLSTDMRESRHSDAVSSDAIRLCCANGGEIVASKQILVMRSTFFR